MAEFENDNMQNSNSKVMQMPPEMPPFGLGRVRHVPTRELGWEFPGWDLSHFAKFGILGGILLIP